MKGYEVFEGEQWISSWNEYYDACQEVDRLNNKFSPRCFHVVKNDDV